MKTYTLAHAVELAREFINKADTLVEERGKTGPKKYNDFMDNPREQGSVKRASMDLTRALADLRAGR